MDFRLAATACVALAALSVLIVAPAPAYDPWSWLLWGREIAHGTLSTAEGPAFKPLPVAVTAILTPLGDAAPAAWVVLARAAAFAAMALAFVLARRLAGGLAAGGLAVVAVALCGAFPTYAATGDVTGLLLALALGAVLAWRAGSLRLALALGVGCALLRVEAWPFLLAAGAVAWRRDPRTRPLLALAALGVPAAWFVPEWLGSGDVLRSGGRARIPNPGQPALADVPFLAALGHAIALPLWPLLAAAVAAAMLATRRGGHLLTRRAAALAAAGTAWIVLVAVMAQAGFSGEARYALPGATLVALGGAIAIGRLPRRALVPAVLLVAVAAVPRLAELPDLRDRQEHKAALARDLPAAIDAAGGRDAVLRCGTVYVGPYRGPLLAYRLDVAKATVEPDARPRPPGTVFRSRLLPRSPVAPDAPGFGAARKAGSWEVGTRCS
jgi:hypothetical protein